MEVRPVGPERRVPPTRSPGAVVGALLVAVLALGGCASAPTAPDAVSSPERTVTELAPPPASDPADATPGPGPSGPRPENGAAVVTRGKSGRGELSIDNGTDHDALVTLSLSGTAVRAVYVRSSSTADLRGVVDGTYDIFVALGDGWNGALHRFTASPQYSRFDQSAPFRTVQESAGTRYTRLSITLAPVAGGDTSTSPVDAGAYPT